MKQADLTSVMAKLEGAQESFETKFKSVENQWADAARRDFEEDFVATIEPNVRRMLDAIARLSTVLANADHQCSSEYQ